MLQIYFTPDKNIVQINKNENILHAALRGGIPLAHVCGGKGRCSTCRIQVIDGLENCHSRTSAEQAIAEQLDFGSEIRLACQTKIKGDVEISRLVSDTKDVELKGLFIKSVNQDIVGVEKHALILFADIRGFTSFAENILPYDVIHVLNRYFYLMNDIITLFGGYIDNYMGDGLMAIFEAQDPIEGAYRAIEAGLGMLEAVQTLIQPYLKRLWGKSFQIGIGLHYGLVVAGTVGAENNTRTTVIGDAVNFASRVESANKLAGTQFLISKDVHTLVAEKVLLGRTVNIEVRGKTGKHTLFEVLGLSK